MDKCNLSQCYKEFPRKEDLTLSAYSISFLVVSFITGRMATMSGDSVDEKGKERKDIDRLCKKVSQYFYIPGYSADVVDFPSAEGSSSESKSEKQTESLAINISSDAPGEIDSGTKSKSESENKTDSLLSKVSQFFYIPGYSADVVDFPSIEGSSNESEAKNQIESLTKDISSDAPRGIDSGKSKGKVPTAERGESQYQENVTQEDADKPGQSADFKASSKALLKVQRNIPEKELKTTMSGDSQEYRDCLNKIKDQLRSGLSDNLQKVITIPHEDPDVTKALQCGRDQLRLIAVWEGFKENDEEQYDYDSQFSNFLSFLYLKNYHQHARQEYGDLLAKIPEACKSIMSLLNKSQYLKCSGECEEAVSVLNEILTILGDHNQTSAAKKLYEAELANLFSQLGLSFYKKALILYTDVLQWVLSERINPNTSNVTIDSVFDETSLLDTWSSYPTESPMMKKLILWAFQAASTMIKLLSKPQLHVLCELVPDNCELDLEIYFKNILNLLDFIIMTKDEVFAGRAKAETGLAYSMYELIGHTDDRTLMMNVPVNYVDQCMNQALEMSPNNPNVLWLVGRYFRQGASDLNGLKHAADVLKKCVDICPSLHMALYDLAMTHRAMWLIEGNFPEAKLYVNKVTGSRNRVQNQPSSYLRKKKIKQKSQRKREQRERQMKKYEELQRGPGPMNSSEDDGACTSTSQEQASESSHEPVPCTPHNQASGMSHEPLNATAKKILPTSSCFSGDLELTTQRATYKRQTSVLASFSKVSPVLAKYPVDGRKCPKYYKKPDYYDILRTNNPEGSEDDVNLRKAQDLLELATKITSESSPRYLIDLARVLISMKGIHSQNEPDQAIVSLFKKAGDVIEERSSDFSNDAAYLYEQWGLLLMKTSKLDDAKIKFRESLQNSVEAKQKSRVAFYKLCDILNKQTEKTADIGQRASLTKEHALINKMIEQYGAARDIILKELKQHIQQADFIWYALGSIDHGQQLVWELIDAFYKENDIEAAFQYLLIVTKFYCAEDLCPDKKAEEVREIACNIAVEAVINNHHKSGAGFENVFHWLFPSADKEQDFSDYADDTDDDGDNNEISPEANETTQDVSGISDSLDSMAFSEEVSWEDMWQWGVVSKEGSESCNLSTSDYFSVDSEDTDCVSDSEDLDIVVMTSDENDEINEIVDALSNSFGLKVMTLTNDDITELRQPGADDIDHFQILEEHLHTARTMFIDIDAFPKESESNNLAFALKNMIKTIPAFCVGFSRSDQRTAGHYLLKHFPGVVIDSSLNPVHKAGQLIRTLGHSDEGYIDAADYD